MTIPRDLIELGGASGRRYRFRRVSDLDQLPVSGGNFVYIKHVNGVETVIGCGASETLHSAKTLWTRAVDEHGADSLYVRLNVSRVQRLVDHDDLSLGQPSAAGMPI